MGARTGRICGCRRAHSIRPSGGAVTRIGAVQSSTVRGSRFRTWEGLRVGQPSATIRERHRSARFRRRAWWLQAAVSPFGDDSEYAVVSAIVSGGRVRALKGWIGAAGE
jgi:hypothetical protein